MTFETKTSISIYLCTKRGGRNKETGLIQQPPSSLPLLCELAFCPNKETNLTSLQYFLTFFSENLTDASQDLFFTQTTSNNFADIRVQQALAFDEHLYLVKQNLSCFRKIAHKLFLFEKERYDNIAQQLILFSKSNNFSTTYVQKLTCTNLGSIQGLI